MLSFDMKIQEESMAGDKMAHSKGEKRTVPKSARVDVELHSMLAVMKIDARHSTGAEMQEKAHLMLSRKFPVLVMCP